MTDKNNYAVIMAGGIGSRFWPLSRVNMPKQFMDILGNGKSLIQLTYERLCKIIPAQNILVVANEQYKDLIKKSIPEIKDNQILSEPFAKNTAPCIAYATYRIYQKNPDARVVVAPSDHLILNEERFVNQLQKGFDFVKKNDALLTLGIEPHRPDTGYGYIQYLKGKPGIEIHKVKTFTEKPSLELAQSFLESGDFLWNAGIFIWNVNAIRKALKKHLPDLDVLFSRGKNYFGTSEEKEFIEQIYPLCINISIDYGVIEKADNVYVLPSEFGWSDLGTWKSLHDMVQGENNQTENTIINAETLINDSTGCLVISSDQRLIVLQGLKDLYIVSTPDALLICNKDQEQEVKNIVTDIKKKYNSTFN